MTVPVMASGVIGASLLSSGVSQGLGNDRWDWGWPLIVAGSLMLIPLALQWRKFRKERQR